MSIRAQYTSRFHHAIGAMHITQIAIETLRNKGHEISATEEEGECSYLTS